MEHGLGYITRSPYTQYSIYLRGTIGFKGQGLGFSVFGNSEAQEMRCGTVEDVQLRPPTSALFPLMCNCNCCSSLVPRDATTIISPK